MSLGIGQLCLKVTMRHYWVAGGRFTDYLSNPLLACLIPRPSNGPKSKHLQGSELERDGRSAEGG